MSVLPVRVLVATILLIDDDAAIRDTVASMLETAGHAVVARENGRDADALVTSEQIDLVVTDLFMPETDGLEVIEAVRRAHPGIPVLVISGGGTSTSNLNMLHVAEMLGAHDVLAKPFRYAALLEKVDGLLGTS